MSPDPVLVLLESGDPAARLEAHLALAERALARGDAAAVRAHCAAAAAIAAGDPRPTALVRSLEGTGRRERLLSAARWAFRREP